METFKSFCVYIQIFLCVSFCGVWWYNNLENANFNIPLSLLLREKISHSSYCVTVCYPFLIYLEQENFPRIFGISVFQMEQELAALSALNDSISKNYFHLNAFSTWEMRIQYLLCHFPAHLWVIERDKKNSWIKLNTNCTRQINKSLERLGDLAAQKHQASLQDGLLHPVEVLKSPGGPESTASISDMWGFGLILKVRGLSEAQMGHTDWLWVSLLCWLTLQNCFI